MGELGIAALLLVVAVALATLLGQWLTGRVVAAWERRAWVEEWRRKWEASGA